MIVVNLMGGLGNQMFQYALGRKLAYLHQTELLLDCTFLNTHNPLHIKREYELDVFKIKASIATDNELKKFRSRQRNSFFQRIYKLAPALFSYHVITERTHAFDPTVLSAPDNSWLNGFWQTEKYFTDIEKIIRADFEFKTPVQGANKQLADELLNCNGVSIHVRRGDYTNPETLSFHGICNPDYYYRAVDVLSQKTSIDKLIVFSDDSAWVKQNLSFNLPVTHIDHNTGKNSFEDLRLMSLCKHNITANSSFSWWGAWLNATKNKTVIAPKNWIADKTVDTSDVIPVNWISL